MMKRGTIVALGLFVVLLGLYFIATEAPKDTVEAPWTIDEVEPLTRVELHRSTGDGDGAAEGTEVVAFEKRRGDGNWWLTQPVEAPAADSVASKFKEAFGGPIRTDDVPLSAENAGKYGLGEGAGVTVRLYGEDTGAPAVEFEVGGQMTVEQTGVKRTFIRRPGKERIYRAQVALGSFVGKSVEEFRSKEILSLERDAISKIAIERADGPTIGLEKTEGGGESGGEGAEEKNWTIAEPTVDWELEDAAVGDLVRTLSRLKADGFADDRDASELGLVQPAATLKVTAGQDTYALQLGRVEGEDGTEWYAKLEGAAFQYKLSTYAGGTLNATLSDLRSKTPRDIEPATVSWVRFPGAAGIEVTQDLTTGDWALKAPAETDEAPNSTKIQRLVDTVARLRVTGFPEVSKDEAGLGRGAERVIMKMQDDEVTLLLGDEVSGGDAGDGGGRYVAYADRDEVYTVSKRTAERLVPTVEDVTGESAGRPGMGGMKGKGGGKLNPAMQQKIQRMMQQKMQQQGR